METIKKVIAGKTIYYQVYNGTNQICEYMEGLKGKNQYYRSRDPDFWEVNEAAKKGVDGMGLESKEEGVKYLKYGYDKELQKIKERFAMKNKRQEGIVKTARMVNSVVGEVVIVPHAIMGIPICMQRRVNVVKKAKVIRLVVLTGFPWHVKDKDIAEAGARITAAVKEVERQGNRMEIYVGEVSQSNVNSTDGLFCITKVKSADQPFDLKRVGFAMCSPAMARWLMMSWLERAEGIPDAGHGHGQAAVRSWGGEIVSQIAKEVMGRNSVVLVQDGHWNIEPKDIAERILKEANETNGER